MTEGAQLPYDLQAFFVKDVVELRRKLWRFASAGPRQMHFVCDFDHTLTTRVTTSDSVGTWGILDEVLPQEGRDRHHEIYAYYRPLEKQGSLTSSQARQWWSKTLDLICSYNINFRQAEQLFLRAVTIRPGGSELFDVCRKAGLPTIILSAGVKQVIELFARKYDISPTAILSTELELTSESQIIGWRSQTLIHALNKREIGHQELVRIRREHPYTILLGDTPDDVHMAAGESGILRVCIMDPRNGEPFSQKHFVEEAFEAGYDLIVKDSLESVVELIRALVT